LEKNTVERQLNALRAGIHELCKQTETNWKMLFENSLCGPVGLSHKQRNDWCALVCVHLGEQVDVQISNNSLHLMRAWHAGG